LRGLIGHHTAPRRAIPNTHANATAWLELSTPTFAPGATPSRSSAPATRRLSSTTSP
jgi:hypothetical protein